MYQIISISRLPLNNISKLNILINTKSDNDNTFNNADPLEGSDLIRLSFEGLVILLFYSLFLLF